MPSASEMTEYIVSGKGKGYNTCIASQAAYRSCSGAFVHLSTPEGWKAGLAWLVDP